MAKLQKRLRREAVARTLEVTRVVEHRYVKALRNVMAAVHSEFAKLWAGGERPTAHDLASLTNRVLNALPRAVGPQFDRMARDIKKSNAKALKAMGIEPGKPAKPIRWDVKPGPRTVGEAAARDIREPNLAPAIQAARDANIALITKAARAYSSDVVAIFQDPKNAGLRVEELAKMLLARGNVSQSRAELIARDQTLKLNANITKIRQQAAGVREYIWSTSKDERVRESHAELEGQTFAWDSPPEPGNPGEDFQCRCIAIPVVRDEQGKDIFGDLPALNEEGLLFVDKPADPRQGKLFETEEEEEARYQAEKAARTAAIIEKMKAAKAAKAAEAAAELSSAAAGTTGESLPLLEPSKARYISEAHIKELPGDVSPDFIDKAAGPLFYNKRLISYLEKNPIAKLEVSAEGAGGFNGAKGMYDPRDNKLYLANPKVLKEGEDFGQPMQPGAIWSISSTGYDAEESGAFTFIHESGHHIAVHDREANTPHYQEINAIIERAFDTMKSNNITPISRYARQSPDEYWAENFAMYHLDKPVLAKQDPVGLQMVETVLRKKGILQ